MKENLTVAELVLGVAEAMGKPVRGTDANIIRDSADRIWRPDLGGAAGAEVLDWLLLTGARIDMHWKEKEFRCFVTRPRHERTSTKAVRYDGIAPTIWVAVCLAVFAWGEDE